MLGECSTPISTSLKSGWKSKSLESHPATKKIGILRRPRSASLGDIPKNEAKGEKRAAPSPPQEQTPERGKGGPSPSYAQVAKTQAPTEEGDWQLVMKKGRKEKEKKEKKEKDLVQTAQGIVAKPRLKGSTPARSGDAIKVSAKDGQSYADILWEMKAKLDPWRAGLEVLSIRRIWKEEVLVLKGRGAFQTSTKSSTRWSVRGQKFRP